MEMGETVRVFSNVEEKVTCVAAMPDGKWAVSGDEAGCLKLWALDSGQCLKVFDRHPACWDMRGLIQASNREFSYNDPIGNLAVAQTYDPENRTFFGHADAVSALAVSPCRRYLISGSRDSTVRLWDLASGKCLWIFGGDDDGTGSGINDVAVSSNGRRVLSLTNKVHAWRLSSKTIHRYFWGILREKPVFVIDDESISGTCMALARSGRSFFVTTDKDRTVSRFRLPTRKRREVFDLEGQTAKSTAVPPDEAFLAVGTNGGVIALFDLRGRTRS
jgi:WD40 repeat protein